MSSVGGLELEFRRDGRVPSLLACGRPMRIGEALKYCATYSALICAALYVIGLCWHLGFSAYWKIDIPARDLDFLAVIMLEKGPRILLLHLLMWLGVTAYYRSIDKRIARSLEENPGESRKRLAEIEAELKQTGGQKWIFAIYLLVALTATITLFVISPQSLIPILIGTACGYAFEKVITWPNPFLKLQTTVFAVTAVLAFSYYDGRSAASHLTYRKITLIVDGLGEMGGLLIHNGISGIYMQHESGSSTKTIFVPSGRVARMTFNGDN